MVKKVLIAVLVLGLILTFVLIPAYVGVEVDSELEPILNWSGYQKYVAAKDLQIKTGEELDLSMFTVEKAKEDPIGVYDAALKNLAKLNSYSNFVLTQSDIKGMFDKGSGEGGKDPLISDINVIQRSTYTTLFDKGDSLTQILSGMEKLNTNVTGALQTIMDVLRPSLGLTSQKLIYQGNEFKRSGGYTTFIDAEDYVAGARNAGKWDSWTKVEATDDGDDGKPEEFPPCTWSKNINGKTISCSDPNFETYQQHKSGDLHDPFTGDPLFWVTSYRLDAEHIDAAAAAASVKLTNQGKDDEFMTIEYTFNAANAQHACEGARTALVSDIYSTGVMYMGDMVYSDVKITYEFWTKTGLVKKMSRTETIDCQARLDVMGLFTGGGKGLVVNTANEVFSYSPDDYAISSVVKDFPRVK